MTLPILEESKVCTSGLFCQTCRQKKKGKPWRESLKAGYSIPNNNENFECPLGKSWIDDTVKPTQSIRKIQVQNRSFPTIRQAATALKAIAIGKKVSLDVMQQRDDICKTCDKQRVDHNGVRWCSVCGCSTSADDRAILNLTAYEENLPYWGCKHPQRKEGKGWPK